MRTHWQICMNTLYSHTETRPSTCINTRIACILFKAHTHMESHARSLPNTNLSSPAVSPWPDKCGLFTFEQWDVCGRYELCVCAARLCQQVQYYCSCLLLCKRRAATSKQAGCARSSRNRILKPVKCKSVTETIYPSVNLNICIPTYL